MDQRASLTDWVWVEAMIMQAMVARITPDLMMVSLTEGLEEWIVTFYCTAATSTDTQQDFIEIAGDAETFLDECVAEKIHATPAIHRPLRGVLRFEKPATLSSRIGVANERVLFCLKPSLVWTE